VDAGSGWGGGLEGGVRGVCFGGDEAKRLRLSVAGGVRGLGLRSDCRVQLTMLTGVGESCVGKRAGFEAREVVKIRYGV
jgi:hypothetical protein